MNKRLGLFPIKYTGPKFEEYHGNTRNWYQIDVLNDDRNISYVWARYLGQTVNRYVSGNNYAIISAKIINHTERFSEEFKEKIKEIATKDYRKHFLK